MTSKRMMRVPRWVAAARRGCASGWSAVGAVELDLGLAAVVLRGFDAGMGEEGVVAFEGHLDAVARVAAFDLAHAAGEDEMAAGDEGDGVADFFDLVHAVGAEEDGLALLAEVDEGVHEEGGVDGIEAAEGLVHDDEVGVVEQSGDELDLLLHALGELFGLLGDGLGDLQLFAPDVGALGWRWSASRPWIWPRKMSWSMTFIFL